MRGVSVYTTYISVHLKIGGGGNGLSQTESSYAEVVKNGRIDYIYSDLDGGTGTGLGFYDIALINWDDLVCYSNSRHNPRSGGKCRDLLK